MSEVNDLVSSADRLSNYLHVVLAIEYDVDAIDRVAKSRRLDDFLEAIYNALRRRLTLSDKLEELLNKAKNDERRTVERAISYIKNFNPSDVEKLRSRLASHTISIKEIASYTGSKAIASTVLFDTLRRLCER